MPTQEQIEAGAEALYEHDYTDGFENQPSEEQERLRDYARVVLVAAEAA